MTKRETKSKGKRKEQESLLESERRNDIEEEKDEDNIKIK